jgi:hypothetical protein
MIVEKFKSTLNSFKPYSKGAIVNKRTVDILDIASDSVKTKLQRPQEMCFGL